MRGHVSRLGVTMTSPMPLRGTPKGPRAQRQPLSPRQALRSVVSPLPQTIMQDKYRVESLWTMLEEKGNTPVASPFSSFRREFDQCIGSVWTATAAPRRHCARLCKLLPHLSTGSWKERKTERERFKRLTSSWQWQRYPFLLHKWGLQIRNRMSPFWLLVFSSATVLLSVHIIWN